MVIKLAFLALRRGPTQPAVLSLTMSITRINHNFKHKELSYDATPNFQPAIKISVFFRKLEGVTFETFFDHWRSVHADLAIATQAFQSHILRYAQVGTLNGTRPNSINGICIAPPNP